MADFGSNPGGKQSISSTERTPKDQGGAPKEGIVNAPHSERSEFGPGHNGIGNTRPGIR